MWLVNFYLTLFTVRVNGANPAAIAGWNQTGATAGEGCQINTHMNDMRLHTNSGIFLNEFSFIYCSSCNIVLRGATCPWKKEKKSGRICVIASDC